MPNDIFNLMISSIESDWPALIGEDEYESFQKLTAGTGLKSKEKASILLGIYTPRQLIMDKKRRPILLSRLKPYDAKKLAQFVKIKCDYDNEEEIYTKICSEKLSKDKLEQICNFFEIEPPIEEDTTIEYDCALCGSHIVEEKSDLRDRVSVKPLYSMHDYQLRVENEVHEILGEDTYQPRCLINMPTGSGKTRTTVDYLCNKMIESGPISIIWLAYNYELCEQASKEFEKAWKLKGNRPINIINFFGKTNNELPTSEFDGVLISTLGKMASVDRNNGATLPNLAKSISYIVFDEAHQIIAPKYQWIVDKIVEFNNNCTLIGLSATPGRKWNEMDEDIRLANYFKKHIAKITIPDGRSPTQYLTDEGYLSIKENSVITYESKEITEEDRNIIKRMSNAPAEDLDFDSNLARKIGLDASRNLKIIEKMREYIEDGMKRIIVFAADVHHSKILTALFKYCGWEAYNIDSTTDMAVRQDIITKFKIKSENPMIICNFNVLTTGFDVPIIDAGIIARPTLSIVLYSQMVGRIIRGPRAGGTKYAKIASVKDVTLWKGFDDSYGYWGDVWYDE